MSPLKKMLIEVRLEEFLIEFAKKHQFTGVFENVMYKECDLKLKEKELSLKMLISKPSDFKYFVTNTLFKHGICVTVKPKYVPQLNDNDPFIEFNAYYFYCLDS